IRDRNVTGVQTCALPIFSATLSNNSLKFNSFFCSPKIKFANSIIDIFFNCSSVYFSNAMILHFLFIIFIYFLDYYSDTKVYLIHFLNGTILYPLLLLLLLIIL